MDRLKHGRELLFRVQVCAGRQPHAAGDSGAEVRQDVAEEVGGDHYLETLRVLDHEHGGGVHQQGVGLNVRELLPDFREDLVPEDHGIVQGIRLADAGQGLSLFPGQVICIADHALAAHTAEDTVLDDDLMGRAFVEPCTGAGILAFTVLPDKDHVDVLPRHVLQRTGSAFQKLYRAEIDILVKAVADGEQQLPERDVVRDAGITHCSQKDGVEGFQRLQRVLRHHLPCLQIVLTSPGEISEFKRETSVLRGCGLQYLDGFRHDLRTDTVARNNCNSILVHEQTASWF